MKKSNNRYFTVLILSFWIVIIGTVLASCKPRLSTVLIDKTCEPPCWYGIIPGNSTKRDVISLLPKISEVDSDSISEIAIQSYGTTNQIKWEFNTRAGDYGGIIYFVNDIVAKISIGPKKGALLLENAIQKLGEPEFTFSYRERGEIDRMVIFLLYPSKGYVLLYNSGRFRQESASVQPTHPIEHVIYFDPKMFDELVESGLLIGQDFPTLRQNTRPWDGYGDILYFEK